MNEIRRYINLFEQLNIDETYSQDNGALFRYLKKQEFDPYSYWSECCEWIDANGYLKKIKRYLPKGTKLSSGEDLIGEDAELFFKLPKDAQKKCAEFVVGNILEYDPVNAPTWAHMSVRGTKLLPRNTWLVHFTDYPEEIAYHGFTIGIDQMDRLGLTTWMKNDSFDKKHGGYNFAFEALSRDAINSEHRQAYGQHAVLFQNSGVEAWHYGDEENQVMFFGKDVDPRDIIVLRRDGEGSWIVKGRKSVKSEFRDRRYSEDRVVFKGDFEGCVKWVIQNFAQYRSTLTRR